MANRKHTWSVLVAAAAVVANTAAFSQERNDPKADEIVEGVIERTLKTKGLFEGDIEAEVKADVAMGQQISSYIQGAEPGVIDDLSKSGAKPQEDQINDVFKSRIAASLVEKARSDPNISFEALTGKLTIRGSRRLGGVEVTAGEVNIYKVTATLAGIAIACLLTHRSINQCVEAAFRAAGSEIANSIEPSDTAAKTR
jgi:hypothetical protein